MQQIDENRRESIESNLTHLILCCKIIRKDEIELCFTENGENIIVDGRVYSACASLKKIRSNSGLILDEYRFETILNSDTIRSMDITQGLFDGALVEIFMIDLLKVNNSQGFVSIFLKRGRIGEITTLDDNKFIARFLDVIYDTKVSINNRYSLTCRATFGDKRCGIKVNDLTYDGFVTNIVDNKSFFDSENLKINGYFDFGHIVFWNQDVTQVLDTGNIKFFINKTFELYKPTNINLLKNMKYTATVGCNKTAEWCSKRFKNIENFRGEPHIPGNEKLYKRNK